MLGAGSLGYTRARMSGTVRTDKDGALGFLIFDHPARRNAISAEMWRQIPGAVEALAKDDDVRVVILRGEGETAFVSGADISEFESRRSGGSAVADYDRAGSDGLPRDRLASRSRPSR